ncbi:MAG: DPP IV N-terminal domain-containing protein [Chloroflexota bacterium]
MIERTRIPIEQTAQFPPPGLNIPNRFVFSRDENRLFYLHMPAGERVQQLYTLDLQTGERHLVLEPPDGGVQEENLSPEEILRRQRERMLAVGVTHFERAEKADRLLIPLEKDLYVHDIGSGQTSQVQIKESDRILSPHISPDGEWIAYVEDAEIHIVSVNGGSARQLTTGAADTGRTNGLAEYIAQEEMGRSAGFWWSPDSAYIAYTEVDETHIPLYRIMHQGKDTVGPEAQEDHRYPFAGAQNAVVKLAVISREGGDPVWMDLDFSEEIYIARVFWWPDGTLGAQLLNRDQTQLDLVRFELRTGARHLIHRETSGYWVNLRRCHFYLLEDGRFVWASERSGFNHLYLYSSTGELVRQLTSGDWCVDDIEGVDDGAGYVYFTGNFSHPTEKQLYRVSLDASSMEAVTNKPGTHDIAMSQSSSCAVDVFSSVTQAPQISILRLSEGNTIHSLHTPDDPRLDDYVLPAPEIVTLKSRDGVLLYGAIYRPPSDYGEGPFPTIVHVYGGPGPQMVANDWKSTAAMQIQYLCQQGFLVFRLDNRGSARRGITFEGAIRHRMGSIEVQDQVDGVRWLVEKGLTDRERVGIFGWSYGGYMSLMSMMRAADTFKVAVAGAPVTHWDGYDTCYTERYMGPPQTNPEGYAVSSVIAHVEGLSGKLLIIHGMLDENVHFRHTARLINALNRARKRYDVLLFPDERHMPRNPVDRVYLNERIADYFLQNL